MPLDLANLPFPISTRRLLLRPHMRGDAAELKAAINESFEDLHAWMHWAEKKPSLEECEHYIRDARTVRLEAGLLGILIFERQRNTLVGSSGFNNLVEGGSSAAIGYWVRKQFSNQGYITESTAALTQYAFQVLEVKRVEIHCDPDNKRSAAVARRLGFTLEQHLKGNEMKPHTTTPRDTLIFVRRTSVGLPDVEATWSTSAR
jgi:ribosomal-protein-serine acetyltransferase